MRKFTALNRILFNSAALLVSATMLLAVSGPAQAVSYTGSYTQNFDSIGTSGNPALPADWELWIKSGGASTWSTSAIPAGTGGVKEMTKSLTQTASSSMLDSSISTSTKDWDQWYNISHPTASDPTGLDRVISTSPTSSYINQNNQQIDNVNAGMGFQLLLTNNTSGALNNIVLSYNIVKFYNGASGGSEVAPGYQLFYTIVETGVAPDSGTWNNAGPNPTNVQIPAGTLGSLDYLVYSIQNATVNLSTPWGTGQKLYLRWVDDNAATLSPDQIIGLDNVNVSAVPIPAAAWLLGTGLIGLVAIRRRNK